MESSDFDLSYAIPLQDKKDSKGTKLISLLIFIIFCLLIGSLAFFIKEIKSYSSIILPVNNDKKAKIKPSPTPPSWEVIGFLPSWEASKNTKVNLSELSQIIYFGLGVNNKGELVKYNEEGNEVLEWTIFNSEYFDTLRKEAKVSRKKILVALKNFDNENIDNLISSDNATTNLIHNLSQLIKEYNLDGINIDFEYFTDSEFPTFKYLNKFLERLNKELKKSRPDLLISFDVNALSVIVDNAYDMPKIQESVDQIILMAYDYHRPDSTHSGPVAPLNHSENEHSIIQSLDSLKGRVDPNKIILGIPFYGYEWQTITEKFQSPTIAGTGVIATYQRVRELLSARPDIKTNWDDLTSSPWFTYTQSGATKQIYYEDEKSIAQKIELVRSRKLGGIAIWALGYEGEYEDLWQVIGK